MISVPQYPVGDSPLDMSWHVSSSGRANRSGKGWNNAVDSVATLLSRGVVAAGHTIYLGPNVTGTSALTFTGIDNLTIIGSGPSSVLASVSTPASNSVLFDRTVTLRNLAIKHTGTSLGSGQCKALVFSQGGTGEYDIDCQGLWIDATGTGLFSDGISRFVRIHTCFVRGGEYGLYSPTSLYGTEIVGGAASCIGWTICNATALIIANGASPLNPGGGYLTPATIVQNLGILARGSTSEEGQGVNGVNVISGRAHLIGCDVQAYADANDEFVHAAACAPEVDYDEAYLRLSQCSLKSGNWTGVTPGDVLDIYITNQWPSNATAEIAVDRCDYDPAKVDATYGTLTVLS